MKLPTHLVSWANRFVCSNSLDHVDKLIDQYADNNDRTLQCEALKQSLKRFRSTQTGFGHDRIGEKLPHFNEDGFFLRTTSVWLDSLKPDIEGVTEYLGPANLSMVVIDHADNLNYSEGKICLFPVRSTLCIQTGNRSDNHQRILRAAVGDNAITHPFEAEPIYIDYVDAVGGCEGKIREDFMLSPDEIGDIVKAFFNSEPVPDRFKSSVPNFCGYHPDLAAEHAAAFGFV